MPSTGLRERIEFCASIGFRLEVVRQFLAAYSAPYRPTAPNSREDEAGKRVALGAQILKVAVRYDVLEARGDSVTLALDTLRGCAEEFAPAVLGALVAIHGDDPVREVREVPIAGLAVGMVLADDLKLLKGVLLATRGSEITASFLERARNFRPRTWRARKSDPPRPHGAPMTMVQRESATKLRSRVF